MNTQKLAFGDFFFSFIHEYSKLDRLMCQKTNLYRGQPRILTVLMTNDGITLKELAALAGLGMSSVSVPVKNLERAGLLKKISDPRDNRICHIYLTEKGLGYALDFHQLIHGYFVDLQSALSPEDSTRIFQNISDATTAYYHKIKA